MTLIMMTFVIIIILTNIKTFLTLFPIIFFLLLSTFRTQREESSVNLFGTKINIDLNNVADLKLKNQANTNLLRWGDKLLAFFEAGVPHRYGIKVQDLHHLYEDLEEKKKMSNIFFSSNLFFLS